MEIQQPEQWPQCADKIMDAVVNEPIRQAEEKKREEREDAIDKATKHLEENPDMYEDSDEMVVAEEPVEDEE